MTEIEAQTLTTCQVASDGSSVRLQFIDANGQAGALAFPVGVLSSLVMTLPALANAALQARHHDPSLRIVYPLGSFAVEAAGGRPSSILTLRTPDGFTVSFEIGPETAIPLQVALAAAPASPVMLQ